MWLIELTHKTLDNLHTKVYSVSNTEIRYFSKRNSRERVIYYIMGNLIVCYNVLDVINPIYMIVLRNIIEVYVILISIAVIV